MRTALAVLVLLFAPIAQAGADPAFRVAAGVADFESPYCGDLVRGVGVSWTALVFEAAAACDAFVEIYQPHECDASSSALRCESLGPAVHSVFQLRSVGPASGILTYWQQDLSTLESLSLHGHVTLLPP